MSDKAMEAAEAVYIEWSAVDDPEDIKECRRQARLVVQAYLDASEPLYRECPECEGTGRDNSELGFCLSLCINGFVRVWTEEDEEVHDE